MKKLVLPILLFTVLCHNTVSAQNNIPQPDSGTPLPDQPSFAFDDSTDFDCIFLSKHDQRAPIDNPLQLLQGTFSGVLVSRPGSDPNAAFNMLVHGIGSLTQQNGPSVWIDGIPVSDLNMIRPEDIEKITVLKNAYETAIYGGLAAQGIVLIETRKPASNNNTWRVGYNSSVAAGSSTRTPVVYTADEYLSNGGVALFPGVKTDWVREILQHTVTHTHHISLQGHVKNTGIWASGGYQNRMGILRNSGYEQFNGRIGASFRSASGKFNIATGAAGYFKNARLGFSDAFRYAISSNPTLPVRDASATQFGSYAQNNIFDAINPVGILEQNQNLAKKGGWQVHARVEWKLSGKLTWSTAAGFQQLENEYGEFYPLRSNYRSYGRGKVILGTNQSQTTYAESALKYSLKRRKHTFQWSAGISGRWNTLKDFRKAGNGLDSAAVATSLQDIFQVNVEDFAQGTGYALDTSYTGHFGGPFTRLLFGNGKNWNIQAGTRFEIANNLKTTGILLPFASATYDFARNIGWKKIHALALQAGYGQAAGNAIDYSGFDPAGNSRWERRREFNGSLLLGIWQNRVQGKINRWINVSSQLVFPTTIYFNYYTPDNYDRQRFDITNQGTDLDLMIDVLGKKTFQWQSNFTFSWQQSKLSRFSRDLPEVRLTFPGPPGNGNITYHRMFEGAPWGDIYSAELLRLEFGAPVFKDLNGDGYSSADTDVRVQANGAPRRWMGWANHFSYKNFEFFLLLRGVYGHSLVHEYRVFYETAGSSFYNTLKTDLLDTRKTVSSPLYNEHIEKASFTRLENIRLQYNLPLRGNHVVGLFVGGNNLFTHTSYTGNDPELRFSDPGYTLQGAHPFPSFSSVWAAGIDRRGAYWLEKQFYAGVRWTM